MGSRAIFVFGGEGAVVGDALEGRTVRF